MANISGVEFDPFADYLKLDEVLEQGRRLRGQTPTQRWGQNGPLDSRDSPNSDTASADSSENIPLTADENAALVIVRNNSLIQSRYACRDAIVSRVEDDLQQLVDLMREMVVSWRQCPAPAPPCAPLQQRPGAYCAFCRQNGEMRRFYTAHGLKDRWGNVTCPVLRAYVCPLCRATGDQAHTLKYCPLADGGETVPLAKALRAGRNCTGQRRFPKP